MKPVIRISVTIFAFIWISSIGRATTENEKWEYNMPSFFKRTYNEWSRDNTCNYERMKSLSLEVEPLRSHRLRMTTQMAKGNLPLKKAELRVEFYGLSNTMAKQNKTFFADIDPIDIRLDIPPIKSSSPYVDEDLIELTFDVTNLYNATKRRGLDVLQFKVKFLRRNLKTAKVFSRATIKAFIIMYERLRSCGFQDAFQQDARAKRSPDVFLEKDDITEGNSTLKFDVTKEEYCHKKESFVTFAEKGVDFVIYPSSYRTSDCILDFRLPESSMETDSRKTRKSSFACCVPTGFDSLTMIFEDVKDDGRPVMSKFKDLAVRQCGCRFN